MSIPRGSNYLMVRAEPMMHGRYISDADPELWGKTALIMPTDNPAMIQAQFDDAALHEAVQVAWFYLPLAAFELDRQDGEVTIDIEASSWGADINTAWAVIS